ncbi:MAG: replication-associated recombination protein A [Bacteroidetes bacterium]|nr:replication-associated recombination protein A [Bacteroidota bacterium]
MPQNSFVPLAERIRPRSLSEFIGQQHLVGPGKLLEQFISNGKAHSMIFWGPPGVGKTTLAQIVAQSLNLPFFTLSAIDSGIKEVRSVIEQAKKVRHAVLFIDEIHRFNKAQQDSLLGAVEKGIITLIGATTENPSFEVINALLSRCQVYILNPLSEDELKTLTRQAIQADPILHQLELNIKDWNALLQFSDGDARKLLNLIELSIAMLPPNQHDITDQLVIDAAQNKMASYDKSGEQHYDIISAFIKSIRGSDPNAAVYWLARMIEGGEDVKFIARRLVILASEDIGNANPNALLLATTTFQAVDIIGFPESRIILAQCVIYLATSIKSNSAYTAINQAQALVKKTGDLPVPLHLRNAPTSFMKKLDYGSGYQYAHEFTGNFVKQEYLPDTLSGTTLFHPSDNQNEAKIKAYLKQLWQEKYNY